MYKKQQRVSFKAGVHTNTDVLDYVYSDVWGLIRHFSMGGAHYFVSFINDYSRKACVYFMKQKSEIFKIFRQWKAKVEIENKLKYLRSDNDMEYKDRLFLQFW